MIVMDASVACKLVVPEPGSEMAKEILVSPSPLIAPSIIRQEVAGVILRKHRMKQWDEQDTSDTCSRWEALLRERFATLVPIDSMHHDAVTLALRLRHPLTDCLYLATALAVQGDLLTADRELFERASTVYDRVRLFSVAS
jgi:predicted nucleic acid-binding protein